MPRDSSPKRGAGAKAVLMAGVPASIMWTGWLTGYPAAGVAVAVVAVVGPLILQAVPTMTASLIALLYPDTKCATERVRVLTDLIDKLR